MVKLSSAGRWAIGKRVPYQVGVRWAPRPHGGDCGNCPGTCWKPEGLKRVGDFFGLRVCFVASRCGGREEKSFPMWGTSQTDSVKLFWPGELEKALNTPEYWQPPQQPSKAEAHSKCMQFCTSNEREIMQCPPGEEFELQCPWLCGASICHMKSPEAMSLGSNVMLKSGFTLSCKIYQRFCLKGANLQEDAWSACLIRGKRQYFPLFFLFLWLSLSLCT